MNRLEILSWYQEAHWFSRLMVLIRSFILPYQSIVRCIPPDVSVLDIACGHGLMLHALVRRNKRITDLDGIDLDTGRLNVARRTLRPFDKVRLYSQDILRWKPPRQYECILLLDILHHLSHQEKQAMLRRVKEWLTPDGMLIVKDVDIRPRWKAWVGFLHDWVVAGIWNTAQASSEVKALMENCGFQCDGFKRIDQWQPYAHFIFTSRHAPRPAPAIVHPKPSMPAEKVLATAAP